MSATNHVLTECAKLTNKAIPLNVEPTSRSKKVPNQIRRSSRRVLKLFHRLKNLRKFHDADSPFIVELQMQYSML